ncbi:MAG: hypothetical protein JRH16_22985, partial [Deltaproteobacteria bacterium]|nr:hypothetical protein [Deltaproteobacteria bacterium]
IDGDERYQIRGRVPERRLTENYFTLWDTEMNTVGELSGDDLALDSERRFTITVDRDAAAGRPNHIRSSPKAREFFIRDVLLDWEADEPNELSVVRLGDPPRHAAKSVEEQAEAASSMMRAYVDHSLRWNRQALDKPANELSFTIDRETDGALQNQLYLMGHFDLSDGEALVLTVNTGGAKYFIAPITNLWSTTNEIVHRTGSLNLSQSVADPDGGYSYVLSVRDPGVYNWLDPSDMHEGILTLRWAEFAGGRPTPEAGVTSRVLPVSELRGALPESTRFVSENERCQQLDARARSYAWRLAER